MFGAKLIGLSTPSFLATAQSVGPISLALNPRYACDLPTRKMRHSWDDS
jgi:hypothetical protein